MQLHAEALPASSLRSLEKVTQISEIHKFQLVGGTALALHLGHRESVDMDFFIDKPFEGESLLEVFRSVIDMELGINSN